MANLAMNGLRLFTEKGEREIEIELMSATDTESTFIYSRFYQDGSYLAVDFLGRSSTIIPLLNV